MNLVAFSYLDQEMFAEATRMDEEILALDPTFAAAYWNRGIIHMLHGRLNKALEDLSEAVELSRGMPSTLALQARVYARSGDEENALAVLAQLHHRRKFPERGYVSPVLIAYVYEGLGRTEDALDWLETAFEAHDGWLVFLNAFPRFESLHDEPRFRDIRHRLNLPEDDLD